MRGRRCELSVPGSNFKMIQKAAGLVVDEVILDLEDAVAPDLRPEARQIVIKALQELDWSGKNIAFRINPVSTHWFYQDLITVVEAAGDKLDAVIMPKVQDPAEVFTVAALLEAIEITKGFTKPIQIEAQIETAQAMANIEAIAASAPGRLASLIFGPGDYAASMGIPGLTIGGKTENYPGHIWHYTFSRILLACRTNNLEAIDGPYAAFKDLEGLEESARTVQLMGFDGKWAIHPSQIEMIQNIFTPAEAEINRAKKIVEAYQQSTTQGDKRGAFLLDNEMIDAANVKMAERTLRRSGLET
jgi:citrate lyase subunit beta / citryl-CoA lyase